MVALRASRAWTRRQFLVRSTSSLAVAALATPHLSRAADRPQIAGGIQSGDVSDGSAVIWARADRPARMRVDYSSVESFKTVIASALRDASPDADFTSKLLLEDLPPGAGHLLSCALRRHRDRHRRRKPHRPFPHCAGCRPVDLVPVVR